MGTSGLQRQQHFPKTGCSPLVDQRSVKRTSSVVTEEQRIKRIPDSAKTVPSSAQASVCSISPDLECRQALSVTVTTEHSSQLGKTRVPELRSVIGSERQVAGKLSYFPIF